MGTYNSWRIDADIPTMRRGVSPALKAAIKTAASITEEAIVEFLGEDQDCWRQWNESSKWYGAEDLVIELSKEKPEIMFCLERNGESGYGKWFYLDGVQVDNFFIDMPMFPSVAKFNQGRKRQTEYFDKKKAVARREEKARKEKELAKLKAQEQLLEQELEDLDTTRRRM